MSSKIHPLDAIDTDVGNDFGCYKETRRLFENPSHNFFNIGVDRKPNMSYSAGTVNLINNVIRF
jgi:hypothetical protein